MRILLCWLSVALAPGALAAAPADPAELFPADSPLFIEVRRPGDIARELEALFQGTVLEDVLPAVNKTRDKQKDQPYVDTYQLGLLGTVLGPELLAEAKRFEGLALGVTGFTKAHEPERAAVLLTGDSHLPGMLMRLQLASRGDLRKVATVEGVDLYQEISNPNGFDNGPIFFPGGAGIVQANMTPNGQVYAYAPGRLFFGSTKEAVSALVGRWKGKEKGGSLLSSPAFVEARELRQSAAVFLFADPKVLASQADARRTARDRDIDSVGWAALKQAINLDGVRSLAVGFAPNKEAYTAELQIRLDGSKPAPLLDLLSSTKLALPVPALAAKDAGLVVALALPQGAGGGERVLHLADAIAKASGTLGITPTEAVQELEEQAKVRVTADILAKVRGVSLLLPPARDWPTDGLPWPALVFQTEDAQAVATAETTVPLLLKLLGVELVEPTTELVGDQKVRSIAVNGPPGLAAIHYGSRGKSFAIGADRSLVAAALASPDKLAPLVEAAAQDACAVMVCPWGPLLPPLYGVSAKPSAVAKERPRKANTEEKTETAPSNPDPRQAARAAFEDLVRSFEAAPPMVLSVRRDKDLIRLTARQPEPRAAIRKSVDKWVEWLDRSAELGMRGPFSISDSVWPILMGR